MLHVSVCSCTVYTGQGSVCMYIIRYVIYYFIIITLYCYVIGCTYVRIYIHSIPVVKCIVCVCRVYVRMFYDIVLKYCKLTRGSEGGGVHLQTLSPHMFTFGECRENVRIYEMMQLSLNSLWDM